MVDGNPMINILYEDNHIIVAEKPINIPVQSDASKDKDFLTMMKEYVKEKYHKPGNVYIGLVHRLDRPVGGIMVFARTSKAAERLSKQIQNHQFEKIYYACALGKVFPKEGEWIDFLKKDSHKNRSYVDESGKEAVLEYQVIAYKKEISLVKIHLKTGRSHQIRVQFSSRGFPLYGDQRYNQNARTKEQIALYAGGLSFYHPITKEKLSFTLPLPRRHPYSSFVEDLPDLTSYVQRN